MMFASLPDKPDHDALEREILELWERESTFAALRALNADGPRFSFFDGPVTANKSLAVHTAWGRTLKDVFQRYKALRGYHQRYQNGFDCQGLWIEVGVERELGLNSKREIEEFGLAEFARRCREVVVKSSRDLTEGSIRLGQWMDWGNDYFTFSDTNIEYIWRFLAHRPRARLALHRPPLDRVVPALRHVDLRARAARAATRIAIDPSLYVRFPLLDRDGEWIVIWTTTPWTLPANVAAAVNPEADYGLLENGEWVAAALFPDERSREVVKGAELVGLRYRGPFDTLEPGGAGRASGDPVGRGRARHGHGHRPHRPGLRRRGLRALEDVRPRRAHARRRERPLLPGRTAGCTASPRWRLRSRSSVTSEIAACSCARAPSSTATPSAGAATRR